MKWWAGILSGCFLLFSASSLMIPQKQENPATQIISAYFKKEAVGFFESSQDLVSAVNRIDPAQQETIRNARFALKKCRLHYKRISFFLEYFFHSEAILFNSPPKYEIEEPFMEYQEPKGMQVIESWLYATRPATRKKAIRAQLQLINQSAADLPALLYGFNATPEQVLESIKVECIRVMTLYITGYDAPLLKSGIEESLESLEAIKKIVNAYEKAKIFSGDMSKAFDQAVNFLKSNGNFDSFDRLFFITRYMLPLQTELNTLTPSLESSSIAALNWNALNLFSSDAINKNAFPRDGKTSDTVLINLGKLLFSEKGLSGDQSRSCASCHKPSAYFSDGLATNTSIDAKQRLPRNSIGLLYASYQYAQFWDGRAQSLEEQVKFVLQNKQEMNSDSNLMAKRISQKKLYRDYFKKIWPETQNQISATLIAIPIAAYIRTLNPFSSPFDKYMAGDHSALTAAQRLGFNLFLGKAECGTCHFAPIFNGLTPPLFDKTEYEVVGTPMDGVDPMPEKDSDLGRYAFFPISFYKQAFKTPTVRNSAMTAPYMHNGGYKTLQSVVDLYDKGGGEGLGLHVPNQTLSPVPLHLTKKEKACLVAFMESLTDDETTFE